MEENRYPVDVISLSCASGELRPLRLRMKNQRVDIETAVIIRESTYVGAESTVFLCKGKTAGRYCQFELKYYLRTHSWWILRAIY